MNPKDALPYYYLALSYGANKKPDDAFRYLQQALERGYYNYEYIILEHDLDGVRKLPAYKTLMKKYFPKKYNPADEQ